ncbi:MAG: hypothetical protein JWO53_540 [Chlamydiia bacterium]|nr:hypothetical protein [Chlamydiia bacterium]
MMAKASSAFFYVNKPQEFMRQEPSEKSKIASEVFYSEEIAIIQEVGDWVEIETLHDGYRGWIRKGAIHTLSQNPFTSKSHVVAKVNRKYAHVYHVTDTEYGAIVTLPFASKLQVLEEPEGADRRWIKVLLLDGTIGFVHRGDVDLEPQLLSRNDLPGFSKNFLDLPYTWGGRSSFGFDCSGFVQMLYQEMGVRIPRDSKDQYTWDGFMPVEMDSLQVGDLVFFGISEDKISHVGMSLGQDQFIHASPKELKPYLRISSLHDPEWSGLGVCTFRAARRLQQ